MMLKRLILVFTLLSLSAALIACSPPTGAGSASAQELTPADRTLTVIGQGQAFGEPDQVQVILGVEIFAQSVEEATGQNEATIQQIMTALKAEGVAQSDIQTVNYGLWAEQIYGDRGPEGIAGYRVTNQIHANIRDIDQLGSVLAAVIDAGANNVHGVTFNVSDPAAMEAAARSAAMSDARQRAESLAELAGVELGEIVIVTEAVAPSFQPLPAVRGGGVAAETAAPSIAPGQLSHQVQLQVTYRIK